MSMCLTIRSIKVLRPHTPAILAAFQLYGFAGWGQQHAAETAEKLIFVSSDVQVAEKDIMTSKEQAMQ